MLGLCRVHGAVSACNVRVITVLLFPFLLQPVHIPELLYLQLLYEEEDKKNQLDGGHDPTKYLNDDQYCDDRFT